jgi:hypothetical protein
MNREQPDPDPNKDRGNDTEDGELERRPDNVGQSGRWRRKDGPSRYGREEKTHSTEQSSDGASGVNPDKGRS